MKTFIISSVFTLSVLLSHAQDTTIVSINGSFEDFAVGTITENSLNWIFNINAGSPAANANFEIVDAAQEGSKALQVQVNDFNNGDDWHVEAVNDPFNVIAGIEHKASVWLKADSTIRKVRLYFGLPEAGNWARYSQTEVSLTKEWKKYEITYYPTAQDAELTMRLGIAMNLSENDKATITIDNLKVVAYGESQQEPEFEPIAKGKDKFLGNIYSAAQAPRFTEYWNQLTPENAGKWGSVEATRNIMNWAELDAAYALAKDNDFPFKLHVLVWGDQQPLWLKSLSEEQQLAEIEEWMSAVNDRYPDIDYIDVVNEPLHDPPVDDPNDDDSGGYYNALGGAGETGWDWVITAFEMAREIFPSKTKLVINDYNIVNSAQNVGNYSIIIELLKARGLIDFIGFQAHAFTTVSNATMVEKNVQELAKLELPIQVTEMDVDGNPNLSASASFNVQLEGYKELFPIFWEHPSIMGVTLWGWRVGHWRQSQDANLVTANGTEKPALEWLRAYVDTAEVSYSVSNDDLEVEVPRAITLKQNYPNPFNPTTNISFTLPNEAYTTLTVFDINGRKIKTLLERRMSSGNHQISFEAGSLASGVYFYELISNGRRLVNKMLLIK